MLHGLKEGYVAHMSDDQSSAATSGYDPDADPDTDATMTAPEEGRPDHPTEPQQPQHSDAELMESQEEEQPADE